MVSALDSRLRCLGSSLGQGHCVVFLSMHFSTQVYKLVLANLILPVEVTLQWTSKHLIRGSRNTPSQFMLQTPG